jgi:hypothetical protein
MRAILPLVALAIGAGLAIGCDGGYGDDANDDAESDDLVALALAFQEALAAVETADDGARLDHPNLLINAEDAQGYADDVIDPALDLENALNEELEPPPAGLKGRSKSSVRQRRCSSRNWNRRQRVARLSRTRSPT